MAEVIYGTIIALKRVFPSLYYYERDNASCYSILNIEETTTSIFLGIPEEGELYRT